MIKYLVMDIDGTLTDGKIYMGPNGEAMKAFSVKDGYVINYILKPANIKPVVITARESSIVQHRCNELGIEEVYQGKTDKLVELRKIIGNASLDCCAYFGDDVLDIKCMRPIKEAGGIVGCPSDAVPEVKAIADYVCKNKAGEGALREFVEWLVSYRKEENNLFERVKKAEIYLKNLTVSNDDIGKTYVIDHDFFYSIQSYDTKPPQESRFESHKKYVDIQIVISGEEIIEIVDVLRLIQEEHVEQNDVIFWKPNVPTAYVNLKKNDSIILYPEMAHRSVMQGNKTSHVVKIVGKVKIHV